MGSEVTRRINAESGNNSMIVTKLFALEPKELILIVMLCLLLALHSTYTFN